MIKFTDLLGNGDKQQMFNIAVEGIIKQGKASMDEMNRRCKYRGIDNCKCAVGHLIPDNLYDPSMEGQTVSLIIEENIHIEFLRSLQSCHDHTAGYKKEDNYLFLKEFKRRITNFAEAENLTISEIAQ